MSAATQSVAFADDTATAGSSVARREVRSRWWALPALLLVAALVLVFANHRYTSDRNAASTAQTTVSSHVAQLLTYNYKSISKELAAEQGWLTGDFRTTYSRLVTQQVLPVAQKTRLVTTASVAASGVVSSSHDHVQLLVFLDVTTQNTTLGQPRLTGSRVLVSAQYVDGSWRISAMNPF